MAISEIVSVAISVQDSAPKAVAFDTPLIFAKAPYSGSRLYAATPAGLDRVLEQLGLHDALWPVRTLQPGETAEALSPCIRPLSFEERSRALRETAIGAARARAVEATQQAERRRAERAGGIGTRAGRRGARSRSAPAHGADVRRQREFAHSSQ